MLTPDTRVTVDGAYMGPIDDRGEIAIDTRKDGAVFFGPDAVANCLRAAACVNACLGVQTETLVAIMDKGYFVVAAAERAATLRVERDQAAAALAAFFRESDLSQDISAETRAMVLKVLTASVGSVGVVGEPPAEEVRDGN